MMDMVTAELEEMSWEEQIQWACESPRVDEHEFRAIFGEVHLYFSEHPHGFSIFVRLLVSLIDDGRTPKAAFEELKRRFKP